MKQLLAAFIFFTRLPFWRLTEIPGTYFKRVVPYWALTGWLTAGCSVFILYACSLFLPASAAILLAILTRALLTGCLHEDGLADFLDGFGGGNTRERILSIMKDSHIGSYGVIGLISYFGLLYLLLSSLPIEIAGYVMLAGDPYAKGVASMIINRLPYARPAEEAKNKTIYSPMNAMEYTISILCALTPLFLWLPDMTYLYAAILPLCTFFFLTSVMQKKIQGYTGDGCGATFLLCELSFYLGVVTVYFSLISTN
ncbi:adenosylcobinamide-GDP ribazoletransferase [Parabacteroides sp. 52]|uniref:adenosylcobinamide-GDP ribazoletransferase n=1 Tax=unclassified Parabacteroides TaxID=2649774 RepID=UPI0013D7C362|nr:MULTISPECIES: adenosylcobinamide-GDP ribazoletransferase [unclassified Parabacteroides]MDH6534301.1 adenosylcobinamide-GDP ribazoletransferase [Parabacteroides sp. PM5-20]NDV55316.1 adenosylcobinamide-GDP ribazoletransferase [Parabacteroides sp. 52]